MEHNPFYLELLLALAPAALAALVMTRLRLPALIGYLLVGVSMGLGGIKTQGAIPAFLAEFGIMTLLFTAGLHIELKKLIESGKQALVLVSGQFLLLFFGGLAIGLWAGLSAVGSIILGVGLWLSSTIVVLGVLNRLGEANEPHGRIMLTVMVIQDLMALSVVALIPTLAQGGDLLQIGTGVFLTLGKAGLMLVFTMLTGKFIFPHVFPLVEDDQEQLLIWPLAWALMHMGIAHLIGFSAESAAFFAGISISALGYSYIVTDKISSLTNFGLVFFFIQVGSGIQLNGEIFGLPLLAMVVLVIIGTPLVNIPSAMLAGFGKRQALVTGLVPAQISEFSLVILALAAKDGIIDFKVVSMLTAATAITMILSSILAGSSARLYKTIHGSKWLQSLEGLIRRFRKHEQSEESKSWDVVMYGADPDYLFLAHLLADMDMEVLVLDSDRARIQRAQSQGLHAIKADYLDPDTVSAFLPEKILISTSLRPAEADIWTIHQLLKHHGRKVFTIAVNDDNKVAAKLHEQGWDLVVNPEQAAAREIKDELDKRLKNIYLDN